MLEKSNVTLKRSKSYASKLLIAAMIAVSLFLVSPPLVQLQGPTADYKNVIADLIQLERIAEEHGNSRSVVHGHRASAEYVMSELQKFNETIRYWTQEVTVQAQVDLKPLRVVLHPSNVTLLPRIQAQVVVGSGSSTVENAALHIIDSCGPLNYGGNFVGVIDQNEFYKGCGPCERMANAIKQGAKAIVTLSPPGNVQGYPFGLAPYPGRPCRNYYEEMKKIAVVGLSDNGMLMLLKSMAADKRAGISIDVVSEYKNYQSLNVLAETVAGAEDKIVIFGSHLDSVRAGPGVNDDGSGAMATLELARFAHKSGISKKTKQKLRFAWWTAEEIGLKGSIHYVEDLKLHSPDVLSAHKVNIDTDMIASPNYVRGVWIAETMNESPLKTKINNVHNIFKNYFAKLDLPITKFEFNGRSDFQPFMDNNIPAGGVITGEDEIKTTEQAELFGGIAGMVLDPCYHQDCDRVQTIRGPGSVVLEQNVKALGHVLELFAMSENIEDLLINGE